MLAVGVIAASAWAVADWSSDPALTVLAVIVLVVPLVPFFVPTGYLLTPEGVEIRRPWKTRRRSWQDFRTVRTGGDLLLLSPFERRTWLERIRGEVLVLEDNRGEVLEYVESMVASGRAGGSG